MPPPPLLRACPLVAQEPAPQSDLRRIIDRHKLRALLKTATLHMLYSSCMSPIEINSVCAFQVYIAQLIHANRVATLEAPMRFRHGKDKLHTCSAQMDYVKVIAQHVPAIYCPCFDLTTQASNHF
jgi:hypothetical protein